MDRSEFLKARFLREPFARFLKLTLETLAIGSATISGVIRKGYTIADVGFANGGFLFTIANSACVYAAMSAIPEGHTRLKRILEMNFISPAPEGERITVVATVTEHVERSIVVAFTIVGTNNEERASGKLLYRSPKQNELTASIKE